MVAQQLEASLQGANHSIYVATANDEEIIGYVAVHWLPCLFLPGPEGYVSELFVVDSVRSQGIGKFLLDAAEEEAKERGSPRLQLINFRDRESYRRGFYEKEGWEEQPDGARFVKVPDSLKP